MQNKMLKIFFVFLLFVFVFFNKSFAFSLDSIDFDTILNENNMYGYSLSDLINYYSSKGFPYYYIYFYDFENVDTFWSGNNSIVFLEYPLCYDRYVNDYWDYFSCLGGRYENTADYPSNGSVWCFNDTQNIDCLKYYSSVVVSISKSGNRL